MLLRIYWFIGCSDIGTVIWYILCSIIDDRIDILIDIYYQIGCYSCIMGFVGIFCRRTDAGKFADYFRFISGISSFVWWILWICDRIILVLISMLHKMQGKFSCCVVVRGRDCSGCRWGYSRGYRYGVVRCCCGWGKGLLGCLCWFFVISFGWIYGDLSSRFPY